MKKFSPQSRIAGLLPAIDFWTSLRGPERKEHTIKRNADGQLMKKHKFDIESTILTTQKMPLILKL